MTLHLSLVPPPVDLDAQLRENHLIILNCAMQLLDNVLETTDDARLTLHLGNALDSAELARERLK